MTPASWTPVGVTQLMSPLAELLLSPKTAWISHLISILFLAGCISCIFGWKWRIASAMTFLLSLVVFGLKNSFGHAFRSESVLILAQLIFLLSAKPLGASWTLRLLRGLWISMFFLGAINKLRFSGWSWVTENYLHDYLLANQITRAGTLNGRLFADGAEILIANPTITLGIGYFVLFFELLYPLILINRLKVPFLVGTVLFQLAVFTLLGVNFLFYLPLLPIWLKESGINEN